MNYEILFSGRFKKSFSKLQDSEKKVFYKKLSLFIENHRHNQLYTTFFVRYFLHYIIVIHSL